MTASLQFRREHGNWLPIGVIIKNTKEYHSHVLIKIHTKQSIAFDKQIYISYFLTLKNWTIFNSNFKLKHKEFSSISLLHNVSCKELKS
jgi:hypothetical protein